MAAPGATADSVPTLGTDNRDEVRVSEIFHSAVPARRPSAEGNTCFPVLCTLATKSECLPAVKLQSPDGSFGIFPLSHAELGIVWCSTEDMWPWEEKRAERDWKRAEALFSRLVEYPTAFLTALLNVFRTGRYADETPVTTKNWPGFCRAGRTKIAVNLCCNACERVLNGSTLWLDECANHGRSFTCAAVGRTCAAPGPRPAGSDIDDAPGFPLPPRRSTVTMEGPWETWAQHLDRHNGGWGDTHALFSPQKNPPTQVHPADIHEDRDIIAEVEMPSQFISGRPAVRLRAPDPTPEQVRESRDIIDSGGWRRFVTALLSWTYQNTSASFRGDDNVTDFRLWRRSMEKFFQIWAVFNPIVQARLAAITFRDKADLWWSAHCRTHPHRVVTFDQLVECASRELVPQSRTSRAHLAWHELEFKGDIDRYLTELDFMMLQYPIEPLLAHALACRPFGKELVGRVSGLDDEAGGAGIPLAQLKHQIRCFAESLPSKVTKRPQTADIRAHFATEAGEGETILACAQQLGPTSFQSSHRTERAPLSAEQLARAICWVCGRRGHMWPQCNRRKTKGCACCGSMAHRVVQCAQRFGRNVMMGETTSVVTADDSLLAPPTASAGEHDVTISARACLASVSSATSDLLALEAPCLPEKDPNADAQVECIRLDVDACGVPPLYDPRVKGCLEYPISLEGTVTHALLDHGASRSFLNHLWCQQHEFATTPLRHPANVVEFSGRDTPIKGQVTIQKVRFIDTIAPWTFLVLDGTPSPVVLGLDIIRAWQLCHNPLNDHVLRINGRVSTVSGCRLPAAVAAAAGISRTGSQDATGGRDGEEGGAWLDIQTYESADTLCSGEEIEVGPPQGLELPEEAYQSSVTATSPEDEEQRQRCLAELDPRLKPLVLQFPNVFSPPDRVPPPRNTQHRVYLLPGVNPMRRAPYPLGEAKLAAMRQQIRELADMGWITPSSSPWGAPILFVRKKGGEWRLCVDFRDLNALTIADSFPMPRLESLLHRAGRACVFSKIDLASGYHQLAVEPESRATTAFRLPEPVYGCTHWEWTVMPFGLKNAPPTFQRAMMATLQGCEDFAVVYMDDVLTFSTTEESHINHLYTVFQRLADHAFHTRLTKCELMRQSVEFLGHRLSADGLSTAPHKVEALRMWAPPLTTVKQVRQFIGLAMWYRCFIPHLATIAAPLTALTSSRAKMVWTAEATEAMQTIQRLVSEAPCLARWDPQRKTRVITDASKSGLGAVLEQDHDRGWRPVAFWSRKLRDPETRYSATDREWLAVVEAVSKRWRGFLEDRPFTLCSDHAALHSKLCKSSHDPPLNDRQCHWVEALLPFPFEFQYLKGQHNVVADALSRAPLLANSVMVVRSLWSGLMEMLRLAAQQDSNYAHETPTPGHTNALPTHDEVQSESSPLRQTLTGQWIVPANEGIRTFLISEAHDPITSGHFGEQKTWDKLSQHWYWHGAREDVNEYVRTCTTCQKIRASNRKPPGVLFPIVAREPGHIVTLDFVSKFTPAAVTSHQQCLVLVDKFSRFVFLEGCPVSVTARDTALYFLRRIIPILGVPRKVISDRGPQFTALVWQELLAILGAKAALATTHHPQTDGQSERTVQTVIRLLRSYAHDHQDRWEMRLPLLEIAINSTTNATTKHAPHVVLFGRLPRLPLQMAIEEDAPPPHDTRLSNTLGTPPTDDWVQQTARDIPRIWNMVQQSQRRETKRQAHYFNRQRPTVTYLPRRLGTPVISEPCPPPQGSSQAKRKIPWPIRHSTHDSPQRLRATGITARRPQNPEHRVPPPLSSDPDAISDTPHAWTMLNQFKPKTVSNGRLRGSLTTESPERAGDTK